jgi:3-methyladenine DNA glycosylase Tag
MPNWRMSEQQVEKPTTGHSYFERRRCVIFGVRAELGTFEKKWPGIKKAFANVDVNKVARLQEPDIEALIANPDGIASCM